MQFWTTKKDFTHYGSFYGVPVYIADPEGECVVAGRNLVWEFLFQTAIIFHNLVIERFVQFFAAVFDYEYEPGFPFHVYGEIEKSDA